jgi:hypothetical protein
MVLVNGLAGQLADNFPERQILIQIQSTARAYGKMA